MPGTYTITGTVYVAGAAITPVPATGTGGAVVSGATGTYSLTVNSGWTGTVTPSLIGYQFVPANVAYTNVVANATGQNYASVKRTDAYAVLSEFLRTAGTNLFQLVGNRVYPNKLPADFANTFPALTIFRRGGTSKLVHEELSPSFQIECYGGSSKAEDAEIVYRTLCDRLHFANGVDTTSGHIMMAREEVEGQDMEDPETGWRFVLSFWQLTIRPKA